MHPGFPDLKTGRFHDRIHSDDVAKTSESENGFFRHTGTIIKLASFFCDSIIIYPVMDSQKVNRMASLQSPYTRPCAFPGAQSYMEYFERPGKHDNAVDGDFLRRHHQYSRYRQ
jgi:hypothetical protein